METNQHHTCRPHNCRPMPGTFRDSGPSSLKTSWGPVSTTGVRTPNHERATSDRTPTNTSRCPLLSFPQPDIQLKHRSEGVQDKRHRPRQYTQYRDKPRALTCLAYTKPGVPD
ncbi:hypothetical protein Taro_020461 [Colocasia esculenta]|uniref:Uncharacterized protein n=1 Tax=Colocasia esculenta TaxID=4460 RepID=A0A843V5B1_COLES|nr:hypothetical protein [Colocasia esculenta]